MRNFLASILLLLLSTTAYAEGDDEKDKTFLLNSQELVNNLFSEVYVEFGDKTRLGIMLEQCKDEERSRIMFSNVMQSIIFKFAMEKLKEKYNDKYNDLDINQRIAIVLMVSSMYNGYHFGYSQASNMVKDMDEKYYCKMAVDQYNKLKHM